GGGIRRLLHDQATIHRVEDWTRSRHSFDAAVYPSVLVAGRATTHPDTACTAAGTTVTEERGTDRRCWHTPAHRLRYDDAPASPWLPAPAAVRAAFHRLTSGGFPLARAAIGRPLL